MTLRISSYIISAGKPVLIEDVDMGIRDGDYLEGYIELEVDEKKVLTSDLVDYVDQLWAYIAEGMQAIECGGRWETYFPGQPIELSLDYDRQGAGRVSVTVGGATIARRTASMADSDFFVKLSESAIHFFEHLSVVSPETAETDRLVVTQLRQLRERWSGTED